MDTRDLKLQLINQILATEDAKLLRTIQRLLSLSEAPISPRPQADDLTDLQREIDDLFQGR